MISLVRAKVLGKNWPPLAAAVFMVLHVALLAFGATVHSPTFDETAHLPAGICHWWTGRFELYRFNPPLGRMVAALPVLPAEPLIDCCPRGLPESRPEIEVASHFVQANGHRALRFYTCARWACIPFAVLGAYVCFRWASELYGAQAGLAAVILWCFDPNILAHGQLITPDMAGTALGAAATYVFWRWLRQPEWSTALFAALVLGLAELSKSTNVFMFLLWPALWVTWYFFPSIIGRRLSTLSSAAQLIIILFGALFVLNAGYGFDGSLKQLKDYQFASNFLGGGDGGNRFAHSRVGMLPVPLPSDYLLGIDLQEKDFERSWPSYLHGEFRQGGWWYYYLYGLAVKEPLGNIVLLLVALLTLRYTRSTQGGWRDACVLLLPIFCVLVLVSLHTGFNHHLRYVLPLFPYAFIWMSRVARLHLWGRMATMGVVACLLASVMSSLRVYPHSLSYFNEAVGGPLRGPEHLLNSNIDWGQDLFFLKAWIDRHPAARPITVVTFGNMSVTRAVLGNTRFPPEGPSCNMNDVNIVGPLPGWYAVSVNVLYEQQKMPDASWPFSGFRYFKRFTPIATAGYSIYIYHITPEQANEVREQIGLAKLP